MKKISLIIVFIFLWAYASRVDMSLRAQSKPSPIPTTEIYTDAKGEVYQVYIGPKGGKYILRKSSKTGKEYKYYLPKKK